jgi:beta-mannanase
MLVLNVPMVAPNEPPLGDDAAAALLRDGARGRYDQHFRTLAQRLVARRAGDTVLVLGWEMNGTTYTGRCAPDPTAWKDYWRRIVMAMRGVPGQRFRFDFAPVRGAQAVPWTDCYPGDDVVDIIGMDSYDQRPGGTFDEFASQPYGLRAHADFAAAHGKPMSYPEWGLYHHGDNAGYVCAMSTWISTHHVAYHSISDYCPHGVWRCADNPRAARAYRQAFGVTGGCSPPVQ